MQKARFGFTEGFLCLFLTFAKGIIMNKDSLMNALEATPVISAVTDSNFESALSSPAMVIFHLNANIMTVSDRIEQAHKNGKYIFIHLDLAEGLGKDKSGIDFLRSLGTDGIISTRGQLIRLSKEAGLMTVQRFFALDSKGICNMQENIETSKPDMIEIMPGIAGKVIRKICSCSPTPVIAGGLIETKAEVTEALGCGAFAVSTGKKELWYL